jgi:hypothetical protein
MMHRVAAIITLLTVALSFAFESTAHSQSLDDINALLRSDEPNVRIAALETLKNHDVKADDEVVTLVRGLASRDSAVHVRTKAIQWLASFDGLGKEKNEVLLDILKNDKDLTVRVAAAQALDLPDDAAVEALVTLMQDLSIAANWSKQVETWIWPIGCAVVIGIAILAVVLVLRYLVFRDLRRTFIIASLAYAFLPHVGMTILTMFVERWLYGEDKGPGVTTVVAAITSAIVIVFAMYFIDRQDARRQPEEQQSAGELEELVDAIETYCGLRITPTMILSHLIRHYTTPKTFVDKKNLDGDAYERLDVAVQQTMWKMIVKEMTYDEAVIHLLELVKPTHLKKSEAKYLLNIAQHLLRARQEL